MTIYERLGVRPVVNAAGTLTRLGGTLMCAEAVQAMNEAARSAVAIDELQEGAMPRYAYEAGCEVVICRHHRNSYDKAFEVAGVRLVEVGLLDRALGVGVREVEPEEIEAVIGAR